MAKDNITFTKDNEYYTPKSIIDNNDLKKEFDL